MNASDVQVFSRIARTRSFAAAADQLGLTRSAVSKCLLRLEKQLGVVLVNRSTRSSSLTDAGRRFLTHAQEVDDALEKAAAAVSGIDQEVVGKLAVSLPTSLGAALAPALIGRFLGSWPGLTLGLYFDERDIDLIGGSIDVAIRVAQRMSDSNLLSRRLGNTRVILVASPGYIETHGLPGTAEDLRSHRCLDLGVAARTRAVWRFRGREGQVEVPVRLAISANTNLPLILAACMDQGIMYVPEILVGGEIAQGRLRQILPEYTDPREQGIYAVFPHHGPPAKVRAFIDFVEQELPRLAVVDRWAPFGSGDRADIESAL